MQRKDQETIERVAEYCRYYLDKNGVLPSTRNIASKLNLSKSGGHRYLVAVKEQGLLRPETNISWEGDRAEKLINNVPCCEPTYQEEHVEEYVFLPDSLFGRGHKYILTATGDSIRNDGISEGDLLIFKKQTTAEDGDIIVALLNGNTIVAKFGKDIDGRQFLYRGNTNKPDTIASAEDGFLVQGVLTFVIKSINDLR